FPDNRPVEHFCRSNFSRGIVTFHTDYVFRTDPGWDIVATGPHNHPKPNAFPLTGIVESDWLPYPFTMNWQIMSKGRVVFEQDEPFCFIYPVMKQALADCEPEIRRMADEPELQRQHDAFKTSRDEFMKRIYAGDEAAIRQAWQRHYFVGRHPDGTAVEGHLNKLRLKEPVDRRGEPKRNPPKRRDPRWADDSILNYIELEQTEANRAGRARIDAEGRLADSRRTYHVASERDAAGHDFLYVENFISAEECALLRFAFDKLRDRVFTSDTMDPYWNGRFIWLKDILAAYPHAGRLMIER